MKKKEFLTNPKSPFPDKYDLEAESKALTHLIEADDPSPSDPLFERFSEYLDRLEQLNQMQAAHKLRQQAEPIVENSVAKSIANIGTLVQDDDVMTLHTRDAMRLFIGKSVGPNEGGYGIAGGKRIAAALRQLWILSASDNPYADQALMRAEERLLSTQKTINQVAQSQKQKIDDLAQKGLKFSILKSQQPVEVSLGFKSPYGYQMAEVIVDFDYATRVIKSAQKRDLVSTSEAHQSLRQLKHRCRSVFEEIVKTQRILMDERLKPLSRRDFLPNADAEALKRVKAVEELLGQCQKDILLRLKEPRHSLNRGEITDADRKLLGQVEPVIKDQSTDDKTLL